VRWVLLTALLDTSGNLLFVEATRAGGWMSRRCWRRCILRDDPAGAWTLKERPTRRQG